MKSFEKIYVNLEGAKEHKDMLMGMWSTKPGGEPFIPATPAAALEVAFEWARVHIISDTCVPRENRCSGCLSCDTLAFFEAVMDEYDIAPIREFYLQNGWKEDGEDA